MSVGRASVLSLAIAVAASGAAGADADPTRYAGTYVYAGTDAERSAISTAVDGATEGMAGRLIARGELMKRSEPRQQDQFDLPPPSGGAAPALPAGADPQPVTNETGPAAPQ